jgi:hypothetical protein
LDKPKKEKTLNKEAELCHTLGQEEQKMTTELEQFRIDLYELLPYRSDALLDLLDALSGNTFARSVIGLSLSALFRRGHSSLLDGIDNFFQASEEETEAEERQWWEQELTGLIGWYLPRPQERPFWLWGLDVTPLPRRFAKTLADRSYVYQPNTLKGNKPVTIGHQASVLAYLPEKEAGSPPWLIPYIISRVRSEQTKNEAGVLQAKSWLSDETLPFAGELNVLVGDSDYSSALFLGPLAEDENLVTITRAAANRVFYRQPLPWPPDQKPGQGHPTWYGEPFRLKEPATWGEPDETLITAYTSRRGKRYTLHLEGWYDRLMRGKRDLPMHKHPFTLVRARLFDAQGKLVFKRPMWLIALGERRYDLSLLDIWSSYAQRVDLEHFFRFGKQKLLFDDSQTPVVEHEVNWWQLVQLAYIQLYLARDLAEMLPRPWEKHLLSVAQSAIASPAMVLRAFARIISRIGSPAQAPKPRGNSPGRAQGDKPGRRKRYPVIKKAKTGQKSPAAA